MKKISIIISVVWVLAFGISIFLLISHYRYLQEMVYSSDLNFSTLETNTHHIKFLNQQIHQHSEELHTYQTLLNYLPQTDAHLRSQKATLDEVQSLRSKISQRLKGRLHILVDTKANILYLKQGVKLIFQTDCSAGRGGIFTDKKTGRRWEFITPQGKFKVLGKHEKPVWIKPDWAFTEEGVPIPPPNDPSRRVEGELGEYLLNLGGGYLIHGTRHENLLGRPASHGCIRLGAASLKELFEKTPVGTEVYIY